MEASMLLMKPLWPLTMFGLNDDCESQSQSQCDGGDSSGDGYYYHHGDNSTIGENSGDSVYCRIGDNDEKDFICSSTFAFDVDPVWGMEMQQ